MSWRITPAHARAAVRHESGVACDGTGTALAATSVQMCRVEAWLNPAGWKLLQDRQRPRFRMSLEVARGPYVSVRILVPLPAYRTLEDLGPNIKQDLAFR